jgi:hypothetical protein
VNVERGFAASFGFAAKIAELQFQRFAEKLGTYYVRRRNQRPFFAAVCSERAAPATPSRLLDPSWLYTAVTLLGGSTRSPLLMQQENSLHFGPKVDPGSAGSTWTSFGFGRNSNPR